ncbi:MAG: ADP-ribosylglycohydrolase family protein [Planctomycetaceae bacterium]|nr:ADP-ribosylglycohydrolase family protein [Planctomycetaceae bacterium]
MSDNEKAQLYKRLIQQTNDWFVLERMRELGFWPEDQPLPTVPQEEAVERTELEAEIAKLRQQNSKVANPEAALAEERKRRWEASKARRAEAKIQKEKERQARREAHEAHKETTIVHAGLGVSGGLQGTGSNPVALKSRWLPVLHRAEELAAEMGIELNTLRWLTYHRRGAAVVHYHRYELPKKTGGSRAISAPKAALDQAQRWILVNILNRLNVESQAHGFVSGRSIVTNATEHVGREVVINLDLKDFFPTITFRRVKGLFVALGYGEHIATVLGLLCTEPPRVAAEFAGTTYHVALGDRVLPQGACTSPAITNAICRRLDRRLAGLAKKHGFNYTRYADDLTFSGDAPRRVGRLLKSVRAILVDEGLTEHPSKTRIMRKSSRQEVTGVTVNEKPSLSRMEFRKLRAILHNAAKFGLESQNHEQHPNFENHLRGKVAFAAMVDPSKSAALWDAFHKAITEPQMTFSSVQEGSVDDRRRGTLIGLAVGDALGAAVEFKPPGTFEPVTNYRAGGPHRLNPGEWTDDTSMALALADSIAKAGWDLDDQARRYCDWWRDGKYSVNGRCFDIGITCRSSLGQFHLTGDARKAASTDEYSSGNGSIMRLAPVSIQFASLFPDRIDELAHLAEESSLTTHASAQCLSACRYFALILAGLISGRSREEVLSPDWEPLSQLRELKPLAEPVEDVALGSFRRLNPPEIKGSGYVVKSLEAALWAFHDARDFEEAVLKAVNLGDDADTTGAVCGQLAGAYWGESGIPARWRNYLARTDLLEAALKGMIEKD